MLSKPIETKFWAAGVFLIVLLFTVTRFYAIWQLPPLGDEFDDINIVGRDSIHAAHFWQKAASPDQSRFSHFLAAPVLGLAGGRIPAALPWLRLLFLFFYLIYLFYNCKLLALVTRDKTSWVLYGLMIYTSCFLASLSIFSITTGGWAYLMFHSMSLYYFYKMTRELQKKEAASHFLLLAFLLALCIASKLFGVLLLAAFFIFFVLNYGLRAEHKIQGVSPRRLISNAGFFLTALAWINFLPLPGAARLWSAAFVSAVYLAVLLLQPGILRKPSGISPQNVTGWEFWAAIFLTVFSLSVIFSPIYLNFWNLAKIFRWFGEWSLPEVTLNRKWYDLPWVMILKFGIAPFLLLCSIFPVWLSHLLKTKLAGFKSSFTALVLIVSGVHFFTLLPAPFFSLWYPLDLFAFLFLPAIWLFQYAKNSPSRRLKAFSVLLIAVIFLSNTSRYLYWFPYAHLDGAQYGKQNTGWSKAGAWTFEFLPFLRDDLRALKTSLKPYGMISVNVQLASAWIYNRWAKAVLEDYFLQEKVSGVGFYMNNDLLAPQEDLLLTSPGYNPQIDQQVARLGTYQLLKTISVKGIEMVHLWKYVGQKKSKE